MSGDKPGSPFEIDCHRNDGSLSPQIHLSSSDLDKQIEQLRRCEIISENEVKNLCFKAREVLCEESNVQCVDAPVTVRTSIRCFTFLYHCFC